MNRSNTIYYKFRSEKKKYSMNFDTTEISIADIKREIIKRRNMEKVPEKFELIFYDENNIEIRDENYKVEPLKLLLIKRMPWYKLSNTFMERIKDPSEISSLRFSDFVVSIRKNNMTTTINYIDPLEKIQPKLSVEIFNNIFACKLCNKVEPDPVIILCCGDTVCEKCAIENSQKCPLCGELSKGYMPNKKVKDLKDRVYGIMNKLNIEITMAIENEEADLTFQMDGRNKLPQLVPISYNSYGTQQNQNMSENLNLYPHYTFFENARFFIIKSSNKENVDLSQKYSEWATTVTNQKKLNEAFLGNNVILIFSINKSGNFQGYAVMTSFISDKVSNIWQNESSVKLGGSFSVQWLSICEMPFSKVKNLVNPINNNEYVIKSRDTQELPKEIAISVCNTCFEQEKSDAYKSSRPALTDTELINKISEDIKKNRESKKYYFNKLEYMQRQNANIRPVVPPVGLAVNQNNPANIPPSYPWPYMGHYIYPNADMSMYPRMPYMYPGMPNIPGMPNMQNLQHLNTNEESKRERSRDKSIDKSVSSKKSRTSQNQ